MAANTYIVKDIRSQISNLSLHFKKLEKKKKRQSKPKIGETKEISIRVEINEIKNAKNNGENQ